MSAISRITQFEPEPDMRPSSNWGRSTPRAAEPQSPSPRCAPRILDSFDRRKVGQLRSEIAMAIEHHTRCCIGDADELVRPLLLASNGYHEGIWHAALCCPHRHLTQDLPIIECAKRSLLRMIESLFSLAPLTFQMKAFVVECVGEHGQTAIQHAIANEKWGAAIVLVRHGADLGLRGDTLGIVEHLHVAAERQRDARGSWRKIDRRLVDLHSTIARIHGDGWENFSEPDSSCPPTPDDGSSLLAQMDDPLFEHELLAQIEALAHAPLARQESRLRVLSGTIENIASSIEGIAADVEKLHFEEIAQFENEQVESAP